jgi:hypothetical protein
VIKLESNVNLEGAIEVTVSLSPLQERAILNQSFERVLADKVIVCANNLAFEVIRIERQIEG